MSQSRESINADMIGRVMSLEQRTKGLQGRISALEARLSATSGGDGTSDPGTSEDVEFAPAPQLSNLYPVQCTFDTQSSVPGGKLNQPTMQENPKSSTSRAFDTTGLVAGAILIGVSLLIFTGNADIIKNPLAAMGCGILLIGTALKRIVL